MGRPLRVLMIAPTPFFGDRGCHVRIYEEARVLGTANVQCEIATYAAGRRRDELTVRRSRVVWGLTPAELGPSYTRPLLDLQLARTANVVARYFQPDVIHAHLHEGILLGALIRRMRRVPLIGDIQGSVTEELIDHKALKANGWLTPVARRIERWTVQQADMLVVSSPTAAEVVARQGVDRSRIMPVPDGVDLTRFRPEPRDRALVEQLGLAGKRVVVFLGVLTEYQGVDALIDVLPRVLRRVPNAHFLIMGYPNVERYRARVRERGLQGSVTLPGRIPYDEAARYLRLGDVAVSPKQSVTEANGKLLNYMACGLPVVAFESPVARELLGPDGVFVPPDDPDRFALALSDLLENPSRAAEIGARLHERAAHVHSWDLKIQQMLRVYAQVLAKSPPVYATCPEPASRV